MPKNIMQTKKEDNHNILFRYTLRQIHAAILASKEQHQTLKSKLNVRDSIAVPTHLGKFLFNGLPLTIYQLNALSVEDASAQMGANYDAVLPECQPHVAFFPVDYLHFVCCIAGTARSAGILLGVRDHAITRHLLQFAYEGRLLTFADFIGLSPEQAAVCVRHKRVYPKNITATAINNRALSHERFNLTPEIPENIADLVNMGNPIYFFKQPFKKRGYALIGGLSSEHVSNPPQLSAGLPSSRSTKRKRQDTRGTEDVIPGLLSQSSMFAPQRRIDGCKHQRKPLRDPDFFYGESSSSLDDAVPVQAQASAKNLVSHDAGVALDDDLLSVWPGDLFAQSDGDECPEFYESDHDSSLGTFSF